jgi:hypothetical protein
MGGGGAVKLYRIQGRLLPLRVHLGMAIGLQAGDQRAPPVNPSQTLRRAP